MQYGAMIPRPAPASRKCASLLTALAFRGFSHTIGTLLVIISMERKREHMAATRQPSHSREEIIDIAFELVDAVGYDGFSMRALGDELGMSAMGVYSYFKSKDDLLRAVLHRAQEELDTSSIPGEHWADTAHRICESMRAQSLTHPHIRLMRYRIVGRWPQAYNDDYYRIFHAQGMPDAVHTQFFRTTVSYMSGFIDPACWNLVSEEEESNAAIAPAKEPWELRDEERFTKEAFHEGLDIIIGGIKAFAAPDPCNWRTPAAALGE